MHFIIKLLEKIFNIGVILYFNNASYIIYRQSIQQKPRPFLKRGPLFYESNESMSHESMSQGYFFNKVGYYILNNRLPVFKLA